MAARALLQRQPGLRAVQRLHLALLVAAQHQRVLGRRHVQAHDVFELLDELRVARDLEAAHEVGLQAVGLPVAHHGAGADLQYRGHLARAPVRGRLRRGLRGQLHQLGHIHLGRWRAARQVALDALQASIGVTITPAPDLHPSHAKRIGDVLVLHALRSQQHNARSLSQPDAGSLGPRQPRQLALLLIRQLNRRGYSQFTSPMQTEVEHWSEAVPFKFNQESNTTLGRGVRGRKQPLESGDQRWEVLLNHSPDNCSNGHVAVYQDIGFAAGRRSAQLAPGQP